MGAADPGNYLYTFINEINASVRSHVASVGGNVLLSYCLTAQESGGRAYRNQTYNLFTVTGDIGVLYYCTNATDLYSSHSVLHPTK
jgi:hypothetical protein